MDSEQQIFENNIPLVSHETVHRLNTYKDMLISWNDKFNLISESTIPHIWTRHFMDSAQLMPYIPAEAVTLADMGAGAGFPGLVLAIMAQDQKRALKIHLIESTGKKADFLQAVADELKLDVTVRRNRIEDVKDLKADIVTARALKALPELLKYANRLIHKETICLFLKGKSLSEELTQAKKYWTFQSELHPSKSSDEGRVLVLKALRYKK